MGLLRMLAAGVLLAACGSDDHGRRLQDAPNPIDAVAPEAAVAFPAREITGGAQHVRGSRFSADVQIGHAFDQGPMTGNHQRLEGNAAVKP